MVRLPLVFNFASFALAILLAATAVGEASEPREKAAKNTGADQSIHRRDDTGKVRETTSQRSRAADRSIEEGREATPDESTPPASTLENERQPTRGDQPNTGVDRLRRPAAP